MRTYTPEAQAKAAVELEGLAPGSTIAEFVTDYGLLREQNRACREGR